MFSSRVLACVFGALLITACKTTGPNVPYPAYVVVDGLPDIFIAGLPGVRAKPLVGATSDATGGSYRIDLPTTWQGTSGAAPDKSLEIFVIEGELSVADVRLQARWLCLPASRHAWASTSSLQQVRGCSIFSTMSNHRPASRRR